jgi:branched-chain amino acid transport system permease protein
MIIYSVTRVVNFAQGEFLMLGGMLSSTFLQADYSLGTSIFIAIVITTLIGMAFYQVVIYPIRRAPAFALILVTFGVSIIIRGVALIAWGTDPRSIPYFTRTEAIPIGGAIINPQFVWIIASMVILACCLFIFFRYTVAGKAFMACSVDASLASLMGIKTERMGLLSFALAACLGAFAGAVMGPVTFPHVGIGLHYSVKGFTAALIGGLNRIEGVIVGGLALGLLEALSAGFISSGSKDAIALAILLVVLTFRHQGLLGGAEAGHV